MAEQQETHTDASHEVDYEHRDVDWKALVAISLVLVAFVIASAYGLVWVNAYFSQSTATAEAARKAPPEQEAHTSLSPDLARQLQQLRQWEAQRLEQYQRVEGESGVVRIPVQRAMRVIVDESGAGSERKETPDTDDASTGGENDD